MNTFENRSRPGTRRAVTVALLLGALGVAGCDFLDPTEVENPRTTDEDLAQADQPTAALLPGLRAQFARAVGASVTTTENASDNYSIHGTGILKELDEPRSITPDIVNSTSTFSAHSIYWHLQELRALADFVLDEIAPIDETATDAQLAEARYYRGMAFLMQAENFSFVPVEEDGQAQPASTLLSLAIDDLETGLALASDPLATQIRAALARAYRWAGDAASAGQLAQAALNDDPAFLFQVEYDASSVENNPFAFLFLRALQEMQPLPRLDFLDPKYTSREAGIAVAKAEEMHLILAEIDFAQGLYPAGQLDLANAVSLADSRGTVLFVDNDPRANADLTIRPRDPEIVIRADANSPFRAGLVLERPDVLISVPTVSATSLDADSILTIAPTETEALWHALWLARQEILFLEGRRMADLGIRLPMMLREIQRNPNISEGDPGTAAVVPAHIPEEDDMDLFDPPTTYTGDLFTPPITLVETEVTMLVDMNRVLAQNDLSPFVTGGL